MSEFKQAIPHILKHEGGYVNNPNDSGGATNYGVSLRFLKGFNGKVGDFDGDGDVDIADIKNMTVEDAMGIYEDFWWKKYKYGLINDQTIATKIFDFSVNMGAKRAHILLQQALNRAFGMNLAVDGIIGPATRGVINSIEDDEEQILLNAYADEAWGFYSRLIARNPRMKVFSRGWKRRAYSLTGANSIG